MPKPHTDVEPAASCVRSNEPNSEPIDASPPSSSPSAAEWGAITSATANLSLNDASLYTIPRTKAILTPALSSRLITNFFESTSSSNSTSAESDLPSYTYSGSGTEWSCELRLPPLAAFRTKRSFTSPLSTNKQTAQRVCAFKAAIELHKVGALDDNLLPVKAGAGAKRVDVDGREIAQEDVPLTLEIEVANSFGDVHSLGSDTFLHIFELAEEGKEAIVVGLVTGASLAAFKEGALFPSEGRTIKVRITRTKQLDWEGDNRKKTLNALQDLNRMSTGVVLNKRLLASGTNIAHLALWTPLDSEGDIDWNIVSHFLEPASSQSSSLLPGQIIVFENHLPPDRLLRFVRPREDVDSLSPTLDVFAVDCAMNEKEVSKQKRKLAERCTTFGHCAAFMYSIDMSREEAEQLVQLDPVDVGARNLLVRPSPTEPAEETPSPPEKRIKTFPISMCHTTRLSESWWDVMQMLPSLERLIHDRVAVVASIERLGLGSPSQWKLDLLTHTCTPPIAQTGYSYETLECIGDSILKLCTSVHAFLLHPNKDEGFLSAVRQNSISNRFLRQRSLASAFAEMLLPARLELFSWVPMGSEEETGTGKAQGELVRRSVNRKMVGDLLEAVLGAAWLSGGVQLALLAGEKMRLCFGGTTPWKDRRELSQLLSPYPIEAAPASLVPLEDALGYSFTRGSLLVEAVTHRSFSSPSAGYSYERLEFLGDSVLDTWAIDRLYNQFPNATEGNLTFLRILLVSSPTITLVAVRALAIQRHVLHSAPLLEKRIALAVEQCEAFNWRNVGEGHLVWSFSPVKVLGDVFEAVLGAVFLDSGCDLSVVFAILDKLYKGIMPTLVEGLNRDWVTSLAQLKQKMRCTQLDTTECIYREGGKLLHEATVAHHGQVLGNARDLSRTVARQEASRVALLKIAGIVQEAEERGEDGCECLEAFRVEGQVRKARKRQEKVLEMMALTDKST